MRRDRGILNLPINETPITIVDIETTGLFPGADRILEVAAVRIEPGRPPAVIFDTLVNPKRPVAATEIHGITDEDVVKAPTFREIAGELVRAISGSVVAAYNVYFDMKFIQHELLEAGVETSPPHFCVMYMRPMLGLGPRCSLPDVCRDYGVLNRSSHVAGGDAFATAEVMQIYLREIADRDIRTYSDLAKLKKYKFVRSFQYPVFCPALARGMRPPRSGLKSRFRSHVDEPPEHGERGEASSALLKKQNPLSEYWDSLKAALSDLRVTDSEIEELQAKRRMLSLEDAQVRMLHARLFAAVISEFINDKRLDDRECKILSRVYKCLQDLGWAPGMHASS